MELSCVVAAVLPLMTGVSQSGKEWKKKEIIVETFDKFPKKICMTLFGDIADTPVVGGVRVKVSFDIESRSYTCRDGAERWSTECRVWKIEDDKEPSYIPQNQPQPSYIPQPQPQVQPQPQPQPQKSDDLPF